MLGQTGAWMLGQGAVHRRGHGCWAVDVLLGCLIPPLPTIQNLNMLGWIPSLLHHESPHTDTLILVHGAQP